MSPRTDRTVLAVLARASAVLRSAPWPVVTGLSLAAAVAFGVAVVSRHNDDALVPALLAIGVCGAVAGYVLDEEAGSVADATPTSRPRRARTRLPIMLLPGTIAATALLVLHSLDTRTPWLRLMPVAAGSLSVGLALAAGLRRSGNPAPGDLAGVVTLVAVVLVVLADPLRHWVSLTALSSPGYPVRTAAAWTVVVVGSALMVAVCEADPGRPSWPSRTRKAAS